MGLLDGRIDVYHHLVVDDATGAKLDRALGLLHRIVQTQGTIMATQQEVLDNIAAQGTKLDAALTALDTIQAEEQNLIALVNSGANLDTINAAVLAMGTKTDAVVAKVNAIDELVPPAPPAV
jgi:hypothetical protein